jgi:hypothetical protein
MRGEKQGCGPGAGDFPISQDEDKKRALPGGPVAAWLAGNNRGKQKQNRDRKDTY